MPSSPRSKAPVRPDDDPERRAVRDGGPHHRQRDRLAVLAYLFIFNPLSRLQAGLSRWKGDLGRASHPVPDDEFGSLARGFNRMAETLPGLYQNLEGKVQEKTERLEAQRARLEALYESAAFVARADTLEALAQGIARQVRQVARADASAVRWSDEANRKVPAARVRLPASVGHR